MPAPSILVVDDGELDRVAALLGRLRVDWVRCGDAGAQPLLEAPRDLLITSGPRAMRMPELVGEGEPLWVCVYDQDFLPLRERLREIGVHYLVSGDLEPRVFLLFVRQLLHRGEERRQLRRIPLQSELELQIGAQRRKGVLVELARQSCVVATEEPLPDGRTLRVRLPQELIGDGELELTGRLLRARGLVGEPGSLGVLSVIGFDELDAAEAARVDHLLSGRAIGTQVTPLRAEPGARAGAESESESADAAWSPQQGDRRGEHRHHYGRNIQPLRWGGALDANLLLGLDLSLSGVRARASRAPDVGSQVSLALYGRAREEPVLVGARVVRVEDGEVGLRFEAVSAGQRRGLEGLLAASPCAEDLHAGGGAVHVVELLGR